MAKPQSKQPTVTVQVSRQFKAPVERVFDAWLEPEQAEQFLFKTATGEMTKVEIDARRGGFFTITEKRDDEDVEHVGKYVVLDRPRRLVFTFGVPKYTSEITRVEIKIAAQKNGCDLTLIHEGVWADYEDKTKEGWGKILGGLAEVVE
jgi:uncharacterized protein YndB with AHSA1/START domain